MAHEIAALLGTDLVGVYLHGSAAHGSFNPDQSDVDLIVVIKQPLDEARKAALAQLLLTESNRPYPLEFSVIDETSLRPWRHPAPFDFHFSEGWRERIEHTLERGRFELDYSRTNEDLAAESSRPSGSAVSVSEVCRSPRSFPRSRLRTSWTRSLVTFAGPRRTGGTCTAS